MSRPVALVPLKIRVQPWHTPLCECSCRACCGCLYAGLCPACAYADVDAALLGPPAWTPACLRFYFLQCIGQAGHDTRYGEVLQGAAAVAEAGLLAQQRSVVERRFGLEASASDCPTVLFCGPCAMTQELHEIEFRATQPLVAVAPAPQRMARPPQGVRL